MFRKVAVPLCAAVLLGSPLPARAQLPDGPGRAILETKCSTCHGYEFVRLARRSAEEWRTVIVDMKDVGATVTDEQIPILVEYLATNWPRKDALAAAPATPPPAPQAPDMPAEYKAVLDALGRQGDFRDDVLKVNFPRNDLSVVVDGIATPTPFGFGGWVALEKGLGGMEVMMGDLVLTESEVNPVMSALLGAGINVTALHNHFFFETPRIFYMHVHAHGSAADLAAKLKPALALMGTIKPTATAAGTALTGSLDTAQLAKIVGTPGETSGAVYKITIGRPDIKMVERGAAINARMGLNTWAAFYGNDAEAVVAGDVAMLDHEVQPVLKALRDNGISIVAMHHHMIGASPNVIFLHYWGKGPAQKLAAAVRAAVDQTGKAAR
jgi:hypothetical protein